MIKIDVLTVFLARELDKPLRIFLSHRKFDLWALVISLDLNVDLNKNDHEVGMANQNISSVNFDPLLYEFSSDNRLSVNLEEMLRKLLLSVNPLLLAKTHKKTA